MSMTIVAPTCPLPPCNLTVQEVATLRPELAAFVGLFAACFARADQHTWAHRYLQGVRSDLPRPSIEPMALAHDFPIRALQACMGDSPWRAAPLIEQQHALVAQTLGTADGVLRVDASGMPKQGQHSAGVAHHSCGALGKVTTCQVGVFVGYATTTGSTIVDGQLFVPACWFAASHQALRAAVGMPADLTFQTKSQLAVQLLQAISDRGVLPARWVAAATLYGDSPVFRAAVAALG